METIEVGKLSPTQIAKLRNKHAVRLTKDNTKLQKLIPKRALANWNILLEIFQEMLSLNQNPSKMISTLYINFYREILFSNYENANQREIDIRYLQEFADNYGQLDSFLNELSLVGSSIVTEHQSNKEKDHEILTLTTIHQAKGLEWSLVFLI